MSQALALRNVTVCFGAATDAAKHHSDGAFATVALDGVSLDVAAGAVVAVVGPSGCGKSTMLRAIAGLEPLASGTISLGGRVLDGVPTHERDLGLMFQDHALFPHLSVAANVEFGLTMQQASSSTRTTRSAELLELVGLAGFGERAVSSLSGGEAQRVALARALAPSPSLLMLDEPLGSLDRVLREQLTADLRQLVRSLGLTALHVTHDQAEAFALADHVVVLRDGRIEQQGAPEELWRAPSNRFVAEFLGHPNIWPDPAGAGHLFVPVTSLEVVSDAARGDAIDLEVRVTHAEFREGSFRTSARVEVARELPVGVELVFWAPTRLAAGEAVHLRLSSPARSLG